MPTLVKCNQTLHTSSSSPGQTNPQQSYAKAHGLKMRVENWGWRGGGGGGSGGVSWEMGCWLPRWKSALATTSGKVHYNLHKYFVIASFSLAAAAISQLREQHICTRIKLLHPHHEMTPGSSGDKGNSEMMMAMENQIKKANTQANWKQQK